MSCWPQRRPTVPTPLPSPTSPLIERLLTSAAVDGELDLRPLDLREAWEVLYRAMRITQEALDEPLGGVVLRVLRVLRLLRATD